MEYTFFDFLTLIGSLGLFLFGMKMMSEGLQKVAGDRLRSILTAMTSNRLKGILTGVMITALIQSSSATTVMVVSFVNAGLMSLIQSIGVIMGANIGTTVTAWIITILGFKVKISALSLPLIGLSLPLIFSKKSIHKSTGEFLTGFALLFMGLQFLKDSVPDIKQNPEILEFLASYTDLGFGSILIFLGIGTLLTVIVQSSSATMALTLVMCNNGWISFEMAAAMVLGENIGTTITANIAAAVANTSAKQAARAHLIFNVIGVVWMLSVFHYFLNGIDWFSVKLGGSSGSPYANPLAIPVALSLFHTMFNIFNAVLLVGFAPKIAKFVQTYVKKSDSDEEFRLAYISTGMLATPELSMLQARKEIELYAKRVNKMNDLVKRILKVKDEREFNKTLSRIEKYEQICDNLEIEIADYLSHVSEQKLTGVNTIRIRSMMRMISDIESVADANHNLAKIIVRKRNANVEFDDEVNGDIAHMLKLVDKALDHMELNIAASSASAVDINTAMNHETEINNFRNQMKVKHMENIKSKRYKYKAGVFFNDIIIECEKMGDSIINISEALIEETA